MVKLMADINTVFDQVHKGNYGCYALQYEVEGGWGETKVKLETMDRI